MAIANLIYMLGDNVSTSDIYPDRFMPPATNVPPPGQCAFADIIQLHNILIQTPVGQSIAISCGDNFGWGVPDRLEAVAALLSYNLTIVAKSISLDFLRYCGDPLRLRLIQCPTLIAAVNDVLDIQPNHVLNLTTGIAYPIVLSIPVIHKLGDFVSTSDIYPDMYLPGTSGASIPPPPAQCAFGNIPVLNNLLITKTPGKAIALVCGSSFGCGTSRPLAVQALTGNLTELNIITKSANPTFYYNCRSSGFQIVLCPGFYADVDDEIEIQTSKVINKSKKLEFDRKYLDPLNYLFMFLSYFLRWLWSILTGKKK